MDIRERYQVWFIIFLIKKTGLKMSVNEQQAEELHKQVIKRSKRRKVYGGFKDNIWAVGLAEMGISSLHIYYVS